MYCIATCDVHARFLSTLANISMLCLKQESLAFSLLLEQALPNFHYFWQKCYLESKQLRDASCGRPSCIIIIIGQPTTAGVWFCIHNDMARCVQLCMECVVQTCSGVGDTQSSWGFRGDGYDAAAGIHGVGY